MKETFVIAMVTSMIFWSKDAIANPAETAERLPGKYTLTYNGTLLSVEAVKSYHSDGSYESVGTAKVLGLTKKLIHRGKWRFENGELIYTLTESSTPSEAPLGVPLKFKVLSHDGKILQYRDEQRDRNYTEKRIGDAGT